MTFSLLGRCERSGALGVVVASSSPAVAARCAHARPGVGVAASQNVTDPRLGPALLDALAAGLDPRAAIERVAAATENVAHIEHRQLTILDRRGRPAARTGREALGVHGQRLGDGCVAAGNLLSGERVLDAMVETFQRGASAELGDRLIGVLQAAEAAGGEVGPVHSAGLVVVADVAWPVVDLRVDWHDDPVTELARVWDVYRPQLTDYVTRALDPTAAPGYGVPGE